MNSDYAPIVKKVRDEFNVNTLLSTPETNALERRYANGRAYVPIVYGLLLGNSLIFAQRYGHLQSRNFFLASVVLSYPLATVICKYLFGYQKLRDLTKADYDTAASSAVYKNLTDNKK
jgi:hypothetical protein